MGRETTLVRGFPLAYARTQRFTLGTPRSITVVDDGRLVAFLRSVDGITPTLSLWVLDLSSGAERLIADPLSLSADGDLPTPEERVRRERARESAGGIAQFSVAQSQPWASFILAGDVYIADLRSGRTRKVATATPAFDARLSPSGAHIAYTVGSTLRVTNLGADATDDLDKQLSPEETTHTVSWGQAEFVAAEEMNRTRGFWWSPQGDALVATRVDVSSVLEWHIADPASPAAKPTAIRYPAAGSQNASVALHLLPISGEPAQLIDWAYDIDGQLEYLADVVWTDENPLLVRQSRDQRLTSIVTVSMKTLTITELRRITDAHWTDLHPGAPKIFNNSLYTIEDLPDRRALCIDGRAITDPSLNVRSIVDVDSDGALITASTDSTEVHVFLVPADGWAPKQWSSEPGVHSAVRSHGTTVVASATPNSPITSFHTSSPHLPPETPTLQIRNYCEDPWLRADPTFLRLGERELASAIFFPSDHDGVTPLPVLLDPYGGPHAQRVLKTHNPHLVSRWFAEQGYVVLVTDGRGTPGRGPAFEREVWGDVAAPVLEDQIAALDAAAALYPFMDLSRVGIRGWSFGGYLAALAVLRAPDRIHAAVAGAPVTDWALYDTHYTERYLGHPDDQPDHYARTNLINEAAELSRPLLLIHGLADDNVVVAHTLQLSSALLASGRSHQVLPLSGVTHMTPQAVVSQNLLTLQCDFLHQHLTGAQR
ncbi:MAG: prolyl oligopeptidase family serine peptidase [Acidimicrobiales bacterium]|nr:prolyl oligopeptidase family serine peptidase [Acidimicrobiales bacterium]